MGILLESAEEKGTMREGFLPMSQWAQSDGGLSSRCQLLVHDHSGGIRRLDHRSKQ